MDISIIQKAVSGDLAAFEKLFQITHDKGFSVAYAVLKDSYEAEDILQDSYIKMYEKLDSLQNPAQFESWFYTIVRNRALDYLRSTKKDSNPDLFSAFESDENPDFVFEDTLVSDYREFNPEANVDYTETKRIIADIIDGLPEMQRKCIILRFQRDMKISEIAERLDMPESTVKSNLNYGKKKIEAEVKALEKQGIRLYSITPLLIIPFLRWMWGNKVPAQLTEAAMEMANSSQFAASSSMGGSSSSFGVSSSINSGSAANVGSVNPVSTPDGSILNTIDIPLVAAGKSAAAKGAAMAAGTAVKSAGAALATKIVAAVAAVSLIGGATAMAVDKSNKDTFINVSDTAYVQAETLQATYTQSDVTDELPTACVQVETLQATYPQPQVTEELPTPEKVILIDFFLKNNWYLSGLTASYNEISLKEMFGSIVSMGAPNLNFGDNGEFSYYVGATGGSGFYQIVDGQIEYTIVKDYSDAKESSILRLEVIDGVTYLIQEVTVYYISGPISYYFVWTQIDESKLDPTHKHIFVITTVNPTCTENGYSFFKCECGNSYVSDETFATGHSYKAHIVEPTQESEGYTEYVCTICNEGAYRDNYTDKLPDHKHDYTEEIVVKPTCTAKGYTTFKCKCGDSYTDNEVGAKGHNYVATVVPPTTESKGYTEYNCSVCDKGSYRDSYTDKLPAPSEEHEHTRNYNGTADPSCTTDGYYKSTCRCGYVFPDIIYPATGHNYSSVDVSPSGSSQGYTEHTCTTCGHSYRDNFSDGADHEHYHHSTFIVKPSSCTESSRAYPKCHCGLEFPSYEIPGPGHDYSSVVVAPTESSQGYTEYTCINCGESYRDSYTDMLAPAT